MSSNYADNLSPYEHKGKLGLPESFDSKEDVQRKVKKLKNWIQESKHTVIFTGAGVSTSAGIPDFRGPKGVWTLEKKGLKPDMNVSWDDAKPTKTHMAISKLVEQKMTKFVISQNIDGLHLRSGIPRIYLAELHGNMFVDECTICKKMYVRSSASTTVGRKISQESCKNRERRPCRGKLRDFVLDWEDELPDDDLTLSLSHSTLSELSIVIGSTLQIIPAGNMPTYTKKNSGKLVIINLQPTKHDKKADLIINSYADGIFEMLFKELGLEIPEFSKELDKVRRVKLNEDIIDWSQCSTEAKSWDEKSKKLEEKLRQKRKAEKLLKQKDSEKRLKKNEEDEIKLEIKTENIDDKSFCKAVKKENCIGTGKI